MSSPHPFGAWVKWRRRELDYTQERLAELTPCSVSTIRKIEAGRLRPSQDLAKQLAIQLELPQEEFAAFMKAARVRPNQPQVKTPKGHTDTSPPETIAYTSQTHASGTGGWTTLRRAAAPQHVSTWFTPFIGRKRELALIADRLADPPCRLLTLVGLGGIGKTRLALEVAKAQHHDFRDGVFIVWLDSLSSPDLLVTAMLDALGIPRAVHADPKAQLLDYVREKQILLVLDTFEHVLDGAELLVEILTIAPAIKLLVTSRERLRLYEEWLLPLQGLDLPDDEQSSAVVKPSSAVQLFLQCTERVSPGAAHAPEDQPHIHRICRLVDGSPLAIELAAAWVSNFTCAEIADEVAQGLDILVSELRNVPDRHRSIRATFAYSWYRLTPEQQRVLRRASVFRGGFDDEAAAFVGYDGDDEHHCISDTAWDYPLKRHQASVQPILVALVNKALLRHNDAGRYEMHELTRQYAHEQLSLTDEVTLAHDRHIHYYLALAEAAEAGLKGEQQLVWFRRLEYEIDNMYAALSWSQETEKREELGLKLAASLWWFWSIRGHIREGYYWLTEALKRAPETRSQARVRALCGAGGLARLQGDLDLARLWLEQSISLARTIADLQSVAHALALLGMVAFDRGEPALACTLEEESIALFRKLPDRWGLARSLSYVALASIDMAATTKMQRSYEESLALFRELGDRWGIAHALDGMMWAAYLEGHREHEAELTTQMLVLCQEVGDMAGVAYTLNALGDQALERGQLAEAAGYYADSLKLFVELGNKRGIAVIRHNLGELALLRGEHIKAGTEYLASLKLFNEIGDQVWLPRCLIGLARLSAAAGDPERGALLLGACEAMWAKTRIEGSVQDQEHYRQATETVAALIHPATYAAAHARGQVMSHEQVIATALSSTQRT